MRQLTFVHLFLRGFPGWCFTCTPIRGLPFHKSACPLDPQGDWRRV